ncbi:LysR family transcriptional regulator [Salinisphaera orenii]|uniref:LysR family transcriptional regulator n=1 Tax=Salinisphaera orenii TaxID=856731 RepID=UPI000DBE9684
MPKSPPPLHYKLSDLRLFLAVVDTGSVSAGARQQYLVPSSVSERLSNLESALGTKLLERSRRGMVPTAAGRVVAEHARQCFAGLERMHADLADYSANVRTSVSLLANSTSLIDLAPRTLASFFRDNPLADVELEQARSEDIPTEVAAGRADLGLCNDNRHPALNFEALARDELVVITPTTHPLATATSVDFEACLAESFIGLRDYAPLHELIVEQAEHRGKRVIYRVRVNDFITVGNLVAAGVGIAIVPRSVIEQLDCCLATVSLAEDWALRHIYVCTPVRSEVINPYVDTLISHLRAAAR